MSVSSRPTDPTSGRAPRVALWGASTAVVYALFLLPTWLLLRAGPRPGLVEAWDLAAWPFGRPPSAVAIQGLRWTAIAAVTTLYLWGYRCLAAFAPQGEAERRRVTRQIGAWSGVFAVVLAGMVPFYSRDLYLNLGRGAEQAFFGLNPYVTPLAEVPGWRGHPMFVEHAWIGSVSPHGPVFMLAARVVCWVSGPNLLLAVALAKVLSAVVFLGTVTVAWRLATGLGVARPWLSLYVVAWNPLVLLHEVGEAHNDLLFALPLLLALLWSAPRPPKPLLALPFWALSALVKAASLFALPFFLVWSGRRGRKRATLAGCAAAVLAIAVCSSPYVADLARVRAPDLWANVSLSRHSLQAALAGLGAGAGIAPRWIAWVVWSAFAGLCGWRLVSLGRRSSTAEPGALAWEVTLVVFVLVAFAIPKFQPWYLALVLPLAVCLEEESRLRSLVVGLSLGQLLAFTGIWEIPVVGFLLPVAVAVAFALVRSQFARAKK